MLIDSIGYKETIDENELYHMIIGDITRLEHQARKLNNYRKEFIEKRENNSLKGSTPTQKTIMDIRKKLLFKLHRKNSHNIKKIHKKILRSNIKNKVELTYRLYSIKLSLTIGNNSDLNKICEY